MRPLRNTNVGLHHAPPIEHDDVRDDKVDGRERGLIHRLTDHLAATDSNSLSTSEGVRFMTSTLPWPTFRDDWLSVRTANTASAAPSVPV